MKHQNFSAKSLIDYVHGLQRACDLGQKTREGKVSIEQPSNQEHQQIVHDQCGHANSNLCGPGVKSVLDSLHVFVGETGEADGISSLRDGVSGIEFARDDGCQGHASRGDSSHENN
jgi:hypothetical protein